jgi:hypothetical protein
VVVFCPASSNVNVHLATANDAMNCPPFSFVFTVALERPSKVTEIRPCQSPTVATKNEKNDSTTVLVDLIERDSGISSTLQVDLDSHIKPNLKAVFDVVKRKKPTIAASLIGNEVNFQKKHQVSWEMDRPFRRFTCERHV